MKPPTRITISLDDEAGELFGKMIEESGLSQSELVRRAIRFFNDHKSIIEAGGDKMGQYIDLLPSGEHIILDIDHWVLFLQVLNGKINEDAFWDGCERVAEAHGREISHKVPTVNALLERLEACNFFKLVESSEGEFTLLLGSDASHEFVKRLVEDFASALGFRVEVTGSFSKLWVKTVE